MNEKPQIQIQGVGEKATLDRILEVGARLAEIQTACEGGDPFAIVPSACVVQPLAQFCPPKRITQRVKLMEAGSFSDYVNLFKTDSTRIFADVTETSAEFLAVLDYHGVAPGLAPAYIAHQATFSVLQTPEFKIWMAANRQRMDQVTFATWLEDNISLLREPTGAALLELVQTLHGKSDVRFTSGIRLQSGGNKLHFDEDVSLRGGAAMTTEGDVELPSVITAGIAPFMGAPLYEIRARLKYKIESRKLALWFETIAVHTIIRDSILLLTKDIADKTGIIPLLGRI